MVEITCFLSLLMGLRTHNSCNQGNKYMKYAKQYCALIYAINSMKEYEVKKLNLFKSQISRFFQIFYGY